MQACALPLSCLFGTGSSWSSLWNLKLHHHSYRDLLCDRSVQTLPWVHGSSFQTGPCLLKLAAEARQEKGKFLIGFQLRSSSHTNIPPKLRVESQGQGLVLESTLCDHLSLFSVSLRRVKGPCLSLDGGPKNTCSLTLRKGEKIANGCEATEWQVAARSRN